MSSRIPSCCADKAARIRKLSISGNMVGIARLDEVIEEVSKLNIDGDRIREELIKRFKLYNYVPPGAEDGYASAVFMEYKKQKGLI